jgi:hypothetical protein
MLANRTKCLAKTRPLTASDLNQVIKKLSLTKIPGPGQITAQMIQELPPGGQKNPPAIVQRNAKAGILAKGIKNSKGNHDYKTWEAAHLRHPYRPISLLPIISKILEKLLLRRLLSDTHSQDWIPSQQFGFRKAHSTIQQCHRLTTIITETLENHQYCYAVFLDVSQTFDKCWHHGLLLKIQQTLPPNYLNTLKSYLQSRHLVVTYKISTSLPVPMLSGVPQGSVLGHFLYTLYTADIPQFPIQP